MEISLEGFSIREYTSKIRDSNVEKCWPFDGNPNKECLPPLSIKKFKWWSHELESGIGKPEVVLQELNEEEEEKETRNMMNCPVCLSFKASTLNAISAHVDSCLSQASKKERKKMRMVEGEMAAKGTKAKQPKKRSITEIFAVAPQVEDMEFDDYDSEDDDKSEENLRVVDIIANVKRKKRKSKENIADLLKIVKKSMKKKTVSSKKGNSPKKENVLRLKGSLQLGLVRKLNSSVSGKSLVSRTKASPKSKKWKRASLLTKQCPKGTGNAVNSILKKNKTASAKTSTVGNVQGVERTKHSRPGEKHVQFSGKRFAYGHSSSSGYLPDSTVLSSMNHQLEKWDHVARTTHMTIVETERRNESAASVVDGGGFEPMNENEGLDERNGHSFIPTFSSSYCRNGQDNGQYFPIESVRLPRDIPLQSQNVARNSSYGRIPGGDIFYQGDATSVPDSCTAPIDRYAAVGSRLNSDVVSLASTSAYSNEKERCQQVFSRDSSENLNRLDLQYSSSLQLSPNDLLTSICSLVDQNQRNPPVYRNDLVMDDFIGLPLNSQGELVKMGSRGKERLNRVKNHSIVHPSTNIRADNIVHPETSSDHFDKDDYVQTQVVKERFRLFPEQSNFKNSDMPTEIGFTEARDTIRREGKGNIQSVHQLGLDLNQMNISSCRCSEYTQKQLEKEKVIWVENDDGSFIPTKQPTMRLMGQDVTVGRSNKDIIGSEDGKVWTDKNVIKEHSPTMAVENSSVSRNFQMERSTLKASTVQSRESQGNACVLLRNDIDPMYAQSYHNWRPNLLPQLASETYPFSYPFAPDGSMNNTLRLPGTDIYGAESHCQCMPLSSTQLLYNQGLSRGCSSFQFPFTSQVCGECFPPSQAQSYSNVLPHWMLNGSQQQGSPLISSQYDADINSNPHSFSRFGFPSIPSPPYQTSLSSQPSQHARFIPRAHDSSSPYSVQRPLIPVPPGFKNNSSINTSYRNMINLKNKLKPLGIKRNRKRPGEQTDSSTTFSKRPTLEIPMEPRDVIGVDKERSSMELNIVGDNRRDGSETSPMVCSSNRESLSRLGPVKLSAGAKHILKPSLNTDQQESRSIHSSIPIESLSNSRNDAQKNPLKIYKL
ncbi:hypothetical protein ACHQM5_018217 [Ranunculus cassubicifolius]